MSTFEWREANREKICGYNKGRNEAVNLWRKLNPDRANEIRLKWRMNNKIKIAETNRSRRFERKQIKIDGLPLNYSYLLWEIQGGRCYYCQCLLHT